ncbi:Flagellar hook protein FlgE [Pseudoalteromonas holothuriae]|uniref:Flagellar basal-body rod protein FlgF n=1 Tax=Pseudoalteromonas holothuriae TaxID=2963714 RepID=A0A9W4VSX3_9GAMM|nr:MULTISPECIES: flagellar basal-body rod protein FlgF [unclassified Pseudoalteromonas]CAH9051076.1 Flagellar hook protein FlgE [Pseudoalteromonas sp. CIP111951]CAH9061734.1 Flagellar hook protein FlgE [Pseudoalteromonas sp. CIP111854]
MFQAFFNGLSGMLSFSKNLDTVSNNISNMNTPGFRAADTFYDSLSGGEGNGGIGTQISGLGYRFTPGDIKQTGNATDVAISGQGFFTLLQDNEQYLTRAGQFTFNSEGILVDKNSGLSVASLSDTGAMSEFDISSLKMQAPKASTSVELSGNLSSGASSHEISGVKVFNKLGEEIELTLKFTKSTTVTGEWSVDVSKSSAPGVVLSTSKVTFGPDGTPKQGEASFSVNIEDSMGGSAAVTFALGSPSNFSQSTSMDTGETSTLKADVKDGSAVASLTSIEFSSDGSLALKYSNGETVKGPSLALAQVKDESSLKLVNGNMFIAQGNSGVTFGKAGTAGLGGIAGKSIELSNVDLSREFADMLVIQRGYQASSRLLNVSNQLLEQLYENTRGR